MLANFLSALALVFVFEGLMPFAFPEKWKKLLLRIAVQDEKVLRISGFFSMMVGVMLLAIVHQFVE
ncbi:hypothetical protein Loa_00802 [Legionella oakridgensis ATCC 33761 = DSM 21215]|uniref:DUF2065 domain-containing protein n=2 Tax=Legionella oakridgensis TaxID=29423 RepID=W0B950_9GAMM|nr:hypothetical protein Loa_00802 [Legionella oakridgensis ATCC 33761 = DSM 21215]ETO93876.1 hypothetical protein LOR_37c04090 [Legionella oakridgensis RV-2-2007]KTD44011.1 hypothetical protein Loak_0271 [Legionella oakridgensis]STY19554.1 Uncharacterized protein conserved in bacteria (DUF2065) [Legionella longbeachae]